MITEKDIKPISNAMLNKIKKLDLFEYPKPTGQTRFYTYFTKFKNELCSVTVAVRNYYKRWFCKQVVVHGIHTDKVWLQDIEQIMGFIKVGWYREGLTKFKTWHDYDWGYNDDKYFQMQTATVVNKAYISKLKDYKYSAIDSYEYSDIFTYLRLYEKYPQCELLVKAGLSNLATSKQILRLCNKDKNFCKWLYKNKDEVKNPHYYIDSIIRAYKQNKPIKEVYDFDRFKKSFVKESNFRSLKEFLKDNEQNKFIHYLIKQKTDGYCYEDYRNACEYLGLDMNEDKNRYPHNFKYWHDIRIDQYHTAKALKDEQERKELYTKFEQVANKYLALQRNLKDDFVVIIAKSPQDLINEGEILHHCVGRMNYDQKFAREESLIFFVRNKTNQQTPFVTLEYSLKNHKVLQCYADHDTKPNDEVLDFVNKKWLPYANRKLRQLAI